MHHGWIVVKEINKPLRQREQGQVSDQITFSAIWFLIILRNGVTTENAVLTADDISFIHLKYEAGIKLYSEGLKYDFSHT